MGRFSPYVNAWACLWTLFVSIIFILPVERPVKANTMNYAAVFLALILAFALMYWWTSGRKFYIGPLIEAQGSECSDDVAGRSSRGDDKEDHKTQNSADDASVVR